MLTIVGYSSLFLTAQPARAAFAIIGVLTVFGVMEAADRSVPAHTQQTFTDIWMLTHVVLLFFLLLLNVLSFHPKLQFPKPEKQTPEKPEHLHSQHGRKMPAIDGNTIVEIQNAVSRHDMFKTNVVSGMDELSLITIALIETLELDVPVEELDNKLEAAVMQEGKAWTAAMFEAWFISTFLIPSSETQASESKMERINIASDESSSQACEGGKAASSCSLAAPMARMCREINAAIVSSNYVDYIFQRLFPVMYIIIVTALLLEFNSLKSDFGPGAYDPSS